MNAFLVQFIALLVVAISTAPGRAGNIAVVLSSDAGVYREALEGFREVVRYRITGVQTLKNSPAEQRDELKKLRSTLEPDLVFVIGTPALQIISKEIADIPIVPAMVFNPFGNVPSARKNVVGISMIPSTKQIASVIRELNPKYRRVGTMFDPSRSALLLRQTRMDFEQAGLQLVGIEIRSPSEVGGALKWLEKEIDILWLWPDEAHLADDILQRILLFSFERKIPVIGLSERHTEIGALLSLSYGNAKDLGRQAGEAANRILADASVAFTPVLAARQTKLAVNLRNARRLGIEVPQSIVQHADNGVKAPVYRDGDWWGFCIKTLYPGGQADVEEHRVTFKNGKLDSDHPSFLTGGDLPGTPSFLAFASVFMDDPTRRWLDFLLLPGKTWQFAYPPARYTRSRPRQTQATAEVVGRTSKPIQTAAGIFEAIEITKRDQLNPMAYSTYFYSPRTKSVVLIKAEIDFNDPRSSGRKFELELMAYGTDGRKSR